MIQVTNKLGTLIYINPNNILVMEICTISEICGFTRVHRDVKFDDKHRLCVKITFTNSFSLVVLECLSDINNKIKESKNV